MMKSSNANEGIRDNGWRKGKCISLVLCFSHALFIIILISLLCLMKIWFLSEVGISNALFSSFMHCQFTEFLSECMQNIACSCTKMTLQALYTFIDFTTRRSFANMTNISITKGVLAQKSLLHFNALSSLFAPAFF